MASRSFLQITDERPNKICGQHKVFYNNLNNILGHQIISRKNITLVCKDGQLFLIYSLECV